VPGAYQFGRFEVLPDRRQLLAAGEPVTLGSRAFDLLVCMLENRGGVVDKDKALAAAWPGLVVEENNLSVQVSALRKVLGPAAIATVPRRGYRFALPVRELPLAPEPLPRAPAAPQRDGVPTIAVLPFDAYPRDPRIALLADGLAEDVIALLARVPGFTVISRSSSFVFREARKPGPDIAAELGVRYLVEGSVRMASGPARAFTQLTDAQSGRVLWSGEFEAPAAQVDDLQADISRAIVRQLQPELTRVEMDLIRRQRPENLDAWSRYHQAVGAVALGGWREESLAEARDHLREALVLDPSFALARAYDAMLAGLGHHVGVLALPGDLQQEVEEQAHAAVALDPNSAEVLGYAGCALSDIGRVGPALTLLREAVQIDPSNAQARVALGAALCLDGQPAAGLLEMRTGMRTSPRDRRLGFWGWALAAFMFKAGQPEDALAEARLAAARDPRLFLVPVVEAAALATLGRAEEARGALAQARRLRPRLTLEQVAGSHGAAAREALAPLWQVAA
jgi:TolB-like protein/Tfp pilus assembly protein PilF